MSETSDTAAQPRDRSPAFPVVPLETALQRLAEFEAHFKRSAARPEKVGDAWSIKTKAYADRIAAAIRYFGLLEYQGAGKDRSVVVSEEGRKYLRAQQEETKREIIKAAALRPKQIAKFWSDWGKDRPANAACLDELVLKNNFSEAGARDFLKVYDATITFSELSDSDKAAEPQEDEDETGGEAEEKQENLGTKNDNPLPPPRQQTEKLMAGERIVFTEEGKPSQYLKLIASGEVDDGLLEALEDFVKRQRKRLHAQIAADLTGKEN